MVRSEIKEAWPQGDSNDFIKHLTWKGDFNRLFSHECTEKFRLQGCYVIFFIVFIFLLLLFIGVDDYLDIWGIKYHYIIIVIWSLPKLPQKRVNLDMCCFFLQLILQ